MTASKRLLLLAYFYPPLGGPAVQRPCKTVKYLAQMGWETDVITIRDIVYHSTDSTLLKECRHRRIFRTASLDPMFVLNFLQNLFRLNTQKLYFGTAEGNKSRLRNLFPIDHKIGWVPFAVRAGIKALLTDRYCAVMVTGGPFSSFLAARRLAQKAKLPLILDYRDLWSLNASPDLQSGFRYRLLQLMEHRLMAKADLVCTATALMQDMLQERFGTTLQDKLLPVFNGYDEADFAPLKRNPQSEGVARIAYIGTLYGERPLTALHQALQQISLQQPDLNWELQMVGNFYKETHTEAAASPVYNRINFVPQQTHADAIQLMLDADILLLVIGSAERKWVLTGKLFEYLRSGRPILTLGSPDCEAASILTSCGHEPPCPMLDQNSIQACLEKLFGYLKTGFPAYKIPVEYERSWQVAKLAAALDNLI